jgi:hypothetical protein
MSFNFPALNIASLKFNTHTVFSEYSFKGYYTTSNRQYSFYELGGMGPLINLDWGRSVISWELVIRYGFLNHTFKYPAGSNDLINYKSTINYWNINIPISYKYFFKPMKLFRPFIELGASYEIPLFSIEEGSGTSDDHILISALSYNQNKIYAIYGMGLGNTTMQIAIRIFKDTNYQSRIKYSFWYSTINVAFIFGKKEIRKHNIYID